MLTRNLDLATSQVGNKFFNALQVKYVCNYIHKSQESQWENVL